MRKPKASEKGNGFVAFLILISLVVILVIGYGVLNDLSTEQVDPSPDGGNYIRMTQPCKWIWCTDRNAQDANTNLENSQANGNNAEARLKDAQATKTVADIELQKQKQLQEYANTPVGVLQMIFTNAICIFFGLVAIVIIVVIAIAVA